MPSATTPLAHGSGRRRRGSPESEDLPVALHTEPLAEGGFVAKRLVLFVVRRSSCCPRPRSQRPSRCASKARRRPSSARPRSPSPPANAQDALEQASLAGEFYYHVTATGFGPYVDQVGRYGGTASSGWVFKVNDASPPVGADKVDAEGRRPRALVLRGLRADRRAADARPSRRRRKGLLRRARRSTTTARPRRVTGLALPRRLEADGRGRPERSTSVPARTRACSCARRRTGAVRSNAVK